MYSYPYLYHAEPEFQNRIIEMATWTKRELGSELIAAERKIWSGAVLTELTDNDFIVLFSFHLALAAQIAGTASSSVDSSGTSRDFIFAHRAMRVLDAAEKPLPTKWLLKIETGPNSFLNDMASTSTKMTSPMSDPAISMAITAGYAPYEVVTAHSEYAGLLAHRYGFVFEPTGSFGEVCFAGSEGLRPGFRTVFTRHDVADLSLARLFAPEFRAMWIQDAHAAIRMLPIDEDAFDQCIGIGRRLRLRSATRESGQVEEWKELNDFRHFH